MPDVLCHLGTAASVSTAPNALESAWIGIVVGFGCIVCRNLGWGPTPGQYHHLREGQGGAQRADHFLGICLCPPHHTGDLGIHKNRRLFQLQHGNELDLLAQTIAEVFRHIRNRSESRKQHEPERGTGRPRDRKSVV